MDQCACNGRSTVYLLLRRTRCILYPLPPLLLAIFWILWCRGRCTDNPSGHYPIWTISAPTYILLLFMPNALSVATLPIYPDLRRMHTCSMPITYNHNTRANIDGRLRRPTFVSSPTEVVNPAALYSISCDQFQTFDYSSFSAAGRRVCVDPLPSYRHSSESNRT